MADNQTSRREFLVGAGATVVVAALPGSGGAAGELFTAPNLFYNVNNEMVYAWDVLYGQLIIRPTAVLDCLVLTSSSD